MYKMHKTGDGFAMTEFEEITIKKIIKYKMVDIFYVNLNVLLGSRHIKNKELSSKLGWDPSGYNQKLNRKSDLKLSTLLNLFMAITDLTDEKNQTEYSFFEKIEEMELSRFFNVEEFRLSELFLNVSAAVAGTEEFLCSADLRKTYRSLKPFVLSKKNSPALTEREIDVYMKFLEPVN